MDDDFSRRANVVEQKRGETVDGVKQKTRKARRKTLDVRKAAGLSLPPLAILRSAMRTHFLFANRESVDSELDAVLAVMTPRRLQDGERLFQGGGGAESLSDTCWVLVEGGLRVRAEGGSGAESVLAPGPGGCLVNPLALVAAFSPDGDAAGAGGKSGRVIEAQGDGVVLWGLQVDDFRRAVAATNLDRMADRIEVGGWVGGWGDSKR
jgi:CRP-like cAMP-binding protein